MEIQKKRVPEFTRESDERLRILVNSCIREADRIGVEKEASLVQQGHGSRGGMQLARSEEQLYENSSKREQERQHCSNDKRLKTVSQRRGVDKTKSF